MKLTAWEPDIQTLVRRIEVGDIDLQPDFQRQEVWPTPKKKRLIDTILRDWSIPPIHLVETSSGLLEVLDGQQRLTAIRDFLANQFAIDGRIEPTDSIIHDMHGMFCDKLPERARRRIQNFPIRCFMLSDYKPDEPSELFYRLNQPMMLTSGEKRNALYGESRDQLKSMVKYMENAGLNQDSLGFSNSRLSYDDVIARFLLFLEDNSISKKSTESRVSDRFRSGEPFSQEIISLARDSIASLARAKGDVRKVRLNKASLLSWLLFCSRMPDADASEFLIDFNDPSLTSMRHSFATDARELFEDRSRLRVSDVSSVIYRDFSLWFAYVSLNIGSPPRSVNVGIIDAVVEDLAQRDDVSFEHSVQMRVTPETWSALR